MDTLPSMKKLTGNFFLFLEWILYLGLFAIAIFFTWGVMQKYKSRAIGITQYEEKIDVHPTITICFDEVLGLAMGWQVPEDFNISYNVYNKFNHEWQQYIDTLSIGVNDLLMSDAKVNLEKLYTGYDGTCYRITTTRKIEDGGVVTEIKISSNGNGLPKMKVYFTSEENSYGATLRTWRDGQIYSIDTREGDTKFVSLAVEKHFNLNCNYQSYYECVESEILNAKLGICIPISVPNDPSLMCQNINDWYSGGCLDCDLNLSIIKDFFQNITAKNKCPKSCKMTQYSGKIISDSTTTFNYFDADNKASYVKYQFDAPLYAKVYEEYIIVDAIGMIGSVGGTLGLFIGFSFSNVINVLIGYLQLFLNKICWKNSKIMDQEMSKTRIGNLTKDAEYQHKLQLMEIKLNKMHKDINDLKQTERMEQIFTKK